MRNQYARRVCHLPSATFVFYFTILSIVYAPHLCSADPLDNWTPHTTGTAEGIDSIVYHNGFVAVWNDSSLNPNVLTSPDGTGWTSQNSGLGTFDELNSITYGNGLFVAVGERLFDAFIAFSADGTNWTAVSLNPGAFDQYLTGVTYGDGQFVAVGNGGIILTSPDGKTWTQQNSGTTSELSDVAYGNGVFVAAGDSGVVLTSPDGINWMSQNLGTNPIWSIAFGNGVFVTGNWTSIDGTNWTESPTSIQSVAISYGQGVYVAVDTYEIFHTSLDGKNWISRNLGTNIVSAPICYGDSTFLMGGQGIVLQSQRLGSATPLVQTLSATSVSVNSAQLNGIINPDGLTSSACFEYGTTTSYGNLTLSGNFGTISQYIGYTISGLMPNTTYHYCVVAANSAGTSLGLDSSFTTQPIIPPYITWQTGDTSGEVGDTIAFSVAAFGTPPLSYQWQFNGQDIPTATNATLVLNSVTVANTGIYSVTISNPYGSVISNPAKLGVDGIDTTIPCYLMTATPLPPRQPGKNNLVLVTHGVQPASGESAIVADFLTANGLGVDIAWITNLCVDISNRLANLGSDDWQVVPYSWVPQAGLGNISADVGNSISSFTLAGLVEAPYENAQKIGTQIGRQIAEQGWARVHLIGHSAGAGLIQSAADAIRANSPGTVIQTTFLDPFLGADYRGLAWYGSNADWSDNYFTYDRLTGTYTQGALSNSYNVDVTWVDPNKTLTPVLCDNSAEYSTAAVLNNYCSTNASSTHGWPYEFYIETALGTAANCALGYGFPLSIEDGGWANIASDYEGNTPLSLCGPSALPQNQNPQRLDFPIAFNTIPFAVSGSSVDASGASVSLLSQPSSISNGLRPLDDNPSNSTGVTAWFAASLTITNSVNFVQFDAAFTDINSAVGLLTVYWDTNQIGTVQEQLAPPGLQTYRFFLPTVGTNGLYVFGFRLDSFNDTSSSVTVTNVATGFVGENEQISLNISLTNDTPLLQLTAATNFVYLIQGSTNLTDWESMGLFLNTTNTAQFVDFAATNSAFKFYRAMMP